MRLTFLLLLTACLAGLSACEYGNSETSGAAESTSPAHNLPELFSTGAGTTFALGKPIPTIDGQYQLILSAAEQGGIVLNQYFDLVVEVRSPVGQAIHFPVELAFDAGMRAHNHGMNTLPVIRSLGNGLFRIEQLLFHMPGLWTLDLRVRRGLVSDRAEVQLELWP